MAKKLTQFLVVLHELGLQIEDGGGVFFEDSVKLRFPLESKPLLLEKFPLQDFYYLVLHLYFVFRAKQRVVAQDGGLLPDYFLDLLLGDSS